MGRRVVGDVADRSWCSHGQGEGNRGARDHRAGDAAGEQRARCARQRSAINARGDGCGHHAHRQLVLHDDGRACRCGTRVGERQRVVEATARRRSGRAGLGQRQARLQQGNIVVRGAGDVLARIGREGLRAVAHGHGVADLAAGEVGIHGHAEAQLGLLVQGQHAAIGGIGAGAHAVAHRSAGELGGVVAGGVRTRLHAGDAQAIVTMDLQAAGDIGSAGGDGIVHHDTDGTILPRVAEGDGVLECFARQHIGGAGASDIGHFLVQRRHQVRPEQIAHEYQGVRKIGVLIGAEGEPGSGGAVGHPRPVGGRIGRAVGNVDQLQIDGEVVDVIRVARRLRTQRQPAVEQAAVPEIGAEGVVAVRPRARRRAQYTAIEDAT